MTVEYFQESDVERWLEDKHGENRLTLDDGSMWEVSPHQQAKVKTWVRFSKIVVSCRMGKGNDYRYLLINTSYSEEAEARYLGAVSDGGQSNANVA